MTGQGIAQILVYVVVLIALGYPLGIYMARVYSDDASAARPAALPRRDRARLLPRSSAPTRRQEQDWKSYGKTVLVFSVALLGSSSTRSSGCRDICS